jgi:HSP20 family protein
MTLLTHESVKEDLARGWEPFRGIEYLQKEMNRLFERMIPAGTTDIRSLSYFPAAEVQELDDEIVLRLEVPGMESKDLNVEITESWISISGERKSENSSNEDGVLRSEFHYGSFERRIPLPANISLDQAKAECKNGMLTLRLPKTHTNNKKKVKLTVA